MVHLDLGLRVAPKDLKQSGAEDGFEFVHPTVVHPKLPLDGHPRDELQLPMSDTVQALSQPGVDVKRHSRV